MENTNYENYDQGNRGSQNSENTNYTNENESQNNRKSFENERSNLSGNGTDDSDDFHKNDDLRHILEEERIDSTGTDPNRYSNLANQDTGSSKSLYNDEEEIFSEANSEKEEDYEAEDISDEAYSDQEQELQNNEANRFKSSSESAERNASPEGTFFNEGI